MLTSSITRYCAGITLWGDYNDLKEAHETVHVLCDEGRVEENIRDFALGLAYDLRKAYEGSREEREFGFDCLDKVKYRGVRILWPIYLLQIAVLRKVAGQQPSTRRQQSVLYTLEACADEALRAKDVGIAYSCMTWLEHFVGLDRDYLTQFIFDCAKVFAYEIPAGKKRLTALPNILLKFHPLSDEYHKFADSMRVFAKEKGCSPHELEDMSDWPEIKW